MNGNGVLSRDDSNLFFEMRMALAIFAHVKLHDNSKSFTEIFRIMTDDALQASTLEEVWKRPEIIDEFLERRNRPSWFGVRERAIVRSWKNCLNVEFIAFKENGHVALLREGYVFEALGMTDPIGYTIKSFPRIVRTALLPFEDRIVHSGFLMSVLGMPSAAETKQMESDIAAALRSGERVSDGSRLAKLAQPLSEKFAQEETSSIIASLEGGGENAIGSHGYHTSEYAGMNDEEREQMRTFRSDMNSLERTRKDMESRLLPRCAHTSPRFALADILDVSPDAELPAGIARDMRIESAQGESTVEAGLRLMHLIREDRSLSTAFLGVLDTDTLKGLVRLYKMGGTFTMDIEEPLIEPPLLRSPIPLACYLFQEGSKVSFIMPNEMQELFAILDLDEVVAASEKRWQILHHAEALARLHGIIPTKLATDLLAKEHSALQVEDERKAFSDALLMYAQGNALACCLLATPQESYLVDRSLARAYLFGGDEELRGIRFESELPEPLARLWSERQAYEPRPLAQGMETRSDVLKWTERLAAMKSLRDYLERHVPDGEDDFEYADRIVSHLAAVCPAITSDEAGFVHLVDELDGMEVEIYGKTTSQDFQHLLVGVANSAPLWSCRGWAVKDVVRERNGRKVFFNDDGSEMCIGPNDSCPCGSGRAYKDCCSG